MYLLFYFTGKPNVAATAELLPPNNCIPSNVITLFDELYLQELKEYYGRESFGTDETGSLHKGMTTSTIIGVTRKTFQFVIHVVPENKTKVGRLMDELTKCNKCLNL